MLRRVLLPSCLILLAACGQQSPPAPAATAPPAAQAQVDGFALSANVTAPLKAGAQNTVTLRLADAAGASVGADALDTVHEHKLHVMIVDVGLEDYMHLHPTANADGTFTVAFTPKLDRPYRLWADFHPKAAGAHAGHDMHKDHGDHKDHTAHGDDHKAHAARAVKIGVDLLGGAAFTPASPTQAIARAEAGGLKFALAGENALKVGKATNLNVSVMGADGKSFGNLEPIMGAFAHLVAFNPGATTMLHAHPQGFQPDANITRGGPELSFAVEPKAPGPMRLFLLVKKDGAEITVPFTVMVGE